MYILRSLYLLWLIPRSWIDAVLVRKKPFAQRYACMKKWSERLLSHYRVTLDVQFQEQLPKDQPILFVCNHQSEFDMLLQMAVLDLPFTFISKKENEKVPYVAAWSKTLEVILFDREDRGSAIHMLREAARRLKAKDNLLIFPEGRCNASHAGWLHAAGVYGKGLHCSYCIKKFLRLYGCDEAQGNVSYSYPKAAVL